MRSCNVLSGGRLYKTALFRNLFIVFSLLLTHLIEILFKKMNEPKDEVSALSTSRIRTIMKSSADPNVLLIREEAARMVCRATV